MSEVKMMDLPTPLILDALMSEVKMMDLPTPLILDILSRLPVKTLLRSRCVSKTWKYLIDDPFFIQQHLEFSLENTTNHAVMFRSCDLYSVDFPALNEAVVIDHPLKCDSIGTDLVGSCNGLLCLTNGEGRGINGTIVYNPATKKCREVPATQIDFSEYTLCERLVYGFGYDEVNDEYKVVRVIQFFNKHPDHYGSEVKVFSLKTSKWRRVQDFPPEYYLSFKRQRGMYVNGCLHWMVTCKPDSEGSKLIVAFKLTSEDYMVVPQPNYSPGQVHLNVEALQKHLCLLINYPEIRSEVWVMKEYGVQESWTKLFTVAQRDIIGPFGYVRPLAYTNDGSKVLLEQDSEKFFWFDLQRQSVERVKIRNMPSSPDVTMMVESLVLGSRKTHKKQRERLRNANMAALPESSVADVVSGSGSHVDSGNVTKKPEMDQQALSINLNLRKEKDNLDGFLSKNFKLKL